MFGNILDAGDVESLASTLAAARVGIAVWDGEDRLVACNDIYRRLVYPGLEHEVYPGRRFPDLLRLFYARPENSGGGVDVESLFAGRMAWRRTPGAMREHVAPDRSFRMVEMPTAGGGLIGIYIDVTEELRNELAARESEARLHALFDNLRNIAYCHGQQGASRTSYDQVGVRIYGRDAPALFGTVSAEGVADVNMWHNIIHPDDRPRYLELERRRREFGEDYDLEFRFVHPATGQTRWAREVAWVIEDPELGQRSFDSYIIDVTDAKQREDELSQAQAKLLSALTRVNQASRAKSAFLANMSHELRTPLNAIIGFAEMIAREQVGPGVTPIYRDYARSVLTGGNHLLALINEILDLTKVEAGKMELSESEVPLAALIDEAATLMRGQLAAKGQRLDIGLGCGELRLRADRQKLLQILMNVLGNAHKFMPPGGRVVLGAERGTDGLVIEIEDDGPGMTADEIEIALAPFGRVSDSLTTVEGTGLGLPLSRSFAELHGGTLELESVKSQGTILRLRLPAARILDA